MFSWVLIDGATWDGYRGGSLRKQPIVQIISYVFTHLVFTTQAHTVSQINQQPLAAYEARSKICASQYVSLRNCSKSMYQ